MLHLEFCKQRANDFEMQTHENTGDSSFHNSFLPPCRGHCLHPGTPFFRFSGTHAPGGRGAAEVLPRHTPEGEGPHGDSDFIQAIRNFRVCLKAGVTFPRVRPKVH